MPFTSITKPDIGDPTEKDTYADPVIDDLNFLYNLLLANIGTREIVTNGSFESDVDADSIPDGWTRTLYTGGSFLHDTSTVAADGKSIHGKRSIKFTSPGGAGNGGGFVTSTDFFECAEGRVSTLSFQHKSSAAGIHNLVEIVFYDSTQTLLSTTTLYDSTSNPTSWTITSVAFTPPTNARYAKLRLTGAKNDNTTAGSAWFDDVRMVQAPLPAITVFSANGTWNVPNSGRVKIKVWGSGAGGNAGGAAGGAGGYGEDIFQVKAGDSHAVTVGVGGAATANGATTSVGSLISATGGQTSGAGGTSSATINITGGRGTAGAAGQGGNAGAGGSGGPADTAVRNGVVPGGGGNATGAGGGAGADGRVVIEYLTAY